MLLVGVRGFEPPTSCSQSKRATGLRYTPRASIIACNRSTGQTARSASRHATSLLSSEFANDAQRFLDGALAIARLDCMLHATVKVLFEQLQGERIQRRLHGTDLGQNVDAVAILGDHLAYTANLAFDAAQTLGQRRAVAALDQRMLRVRCRFHARALGSPARTLTRRGHIRRLRQRA